MLSEKRFALYGRQRCLFQSHQPREWVFTRRPTHLRRGLQPGAESRAVRLAEYFAAQLRIELHAGHARWFALRHIGQRRSDGGRDATCGTICAAIHG